jgi:hypothetical protein
VDVKRIKEFMLRYFIHRTGVQPNDYVKIFLDQELNKAKGNQINFRKYDIYIYSILVARNNFQSLEDIYMVCRNEIISI